MGQSWTSASKELNDAYDVFPLLFSVPDGERAGKNRKEYAKTCARLIAENVLTLGLSNLARLLYLKVGESKKEFEQRRNGLINRLAVTGASVYGYNSDDMVKWLKYFFGVTNTLPPVNPSNGGAFQHAWINYYVDNYDALKKCKREFKLKFRN